MEFTHKPVLLAECIERCTSGRRVSMWTVRWAAPDIRGEIAKRLTTGRLICVDRDQAAIDAAQERLAPWMDR